MHLALMVYPVLAKMSNINFEKRIPSFSGRKVQLEVDYSDDVEAQPEKKGQKHQARRADPAQFVD